MTNVVFVYGQHDPWNVIGRTADLNNDAVAIVIAGREHHIVCSFIWMQIKIVCFSFQVQLRVMTYHRFETMIQQP